MNSNIQLESSWLELLKKEFSKEYFQQLKQFLLDEKTNKQIIFPESKNIFAALNYTPIQQVKVVILGQDPYHGLGQANGLSFSVNDGVAIPPSLQNIYKELLADLGIPKSNSGNLEKWAKQGVLLLNATLTVQKDKPASHQGKGWETFTNRIIESINANKSKIVFILWGKFAQSKSGLIDKNKHLIIQSPHPSPFSADKGFFGSKPFSKTNQFLQSNGFEPINWDLNS